MTDILNSQFNAYSRFLATNMTGGVAYARPSTISVNLDGLADDPAQLAAARTALSMWSQTTGLTFVAATASKAKIVFTNDSSGSAYASWSSGQTQVEVAKNWMQGWRSADQWGIGSYGLQTFIHEIGHALGLDHGGNYNGSGSYATDRLFDIDTWQYSVMSYFSQPQYTANHASYLFVNSPMLADIAAIRMLYGSMSVNVGDTLYGAGSTVMSGATDFGKFAKSSFAIHDNGGYDTFNLSNAKAASLIDLRPGHFSNINGYVGNVGIAADTVIERAFGTAFSDQIYGNDAANTLYGNGGNDMISGGAGNDLISGDAGNDQLYGGIGRDIFVFQTALSAVGNVDTIVDFNVADDVVYLENAVFRALTRVGELAASAFTSNVQGRALDRYDRVIYDKDDGYLFYDADGTGSQAAIKFGKLTAGLALTYHDFIVI